MTTGLLLVMAIAAGVSVANLYYNQPMLALIAHDLGTAIPVGLVAMATQLGYALGLVLLVPLGDRIERRGLILWQTAGLTLSTIAAAMAPSLVTLMLASCAVGVFATIAQQIVPFAADLAEPAARGRTVGTVMSGLLAGILLARVVSGVVGEALGWRPMFWLGAGLTLAMGAMLAACLPRSRPTSNAPYGRLLLSLGHLVRTLPPLRRAALIQACLFGAFSAFWSTLALLLEGPPYHMGSVVAGLFGILGLAGVMAAPLGGRVADRRGPHGIIGAGILIVLAAFVAFGAIRSIAGLVLGVVLLDLGVQLTQISNQTVIFSLGEAARSRINTIFVTGLFLGGAVGSAGGSFAWRHGGWTAVSLFGAGLAVLAFLVHLSGRRAEWASPR